MCDCFVKKQIDRQREKVTKFDRGKPLNEPKQVQKTADEIACIPI